MESSWVDQLNAAMGSTTDDVDEVDEVDEVEAAPWLETGEHPAHPEVAGQPAPE